MLKKEIHCVGIHLVFGGSDEAFIAAVVFHLRTNIPTIEAMSTKSFALYGAQRPWFQMKLMVRHYNRNFHGWLHKQKGKHFVWKSGEGSER